MRDIIFGDYSFVYSFVYSFFIVWVSGCFAYGIRSKVLSLDLLVVVKTFSIALRTDLKGGASYGRTIGLGT